MHLFRMFSSSALHLEKKSNQPEHDDTPVTAGQLFIYINNEKVRWSCWKGTDFNVVVRNRFSQVHRIFTSTLEVDWVDQIAVIWDHMRPTPVFIPQKWNRQGFFWAPFNCFNYLRRQVRIRS